MAPTSSKLRFSHALTMLSLSISAFGASNKAVIAQMFEWSWDSIAAECTEFLGPAGYGYVQTSPPGEHIRGNEWWSAYQPVSYNLISNRGTREQFAKMVATCQAAGVEIIADAVTNHMSGAESGVGTNGSNFTHYDYPGTYQVQDFHHCGLTPNDNILDYKNREQVQKCQLEGLADLATDTDYVQGRIATYLKDLLSLGVKGLRMDAAKHMASSDIANILGRVGPVEYITQEVIWGDGEPVQPGEYVQNGNVQEFRYTSALLDAFTSSGIESLRDLDNRGWLASNTANVFVANHDTERGSSSLNYKSSLNTYTLATVFSLAHPYGANPTILSSYLFDQRDAPAPNNWQGTCNGNTGANGWLCQHRWSAVAGMVGFRNAVGSDPSSTPLNNWQTGLYQQIAFGRGSSGFVAINNMDGGWPGATPKSFTTSLPDGVYCNVYAGPPGADGACAGKSYTVANGSFDAIVPPRAAVALHIGAKAPSSASRPNTGVESPLLTSRSNFPRRGIRRGQGTTRLVKRPTQH